jgi:hypothetical protein
MVVEAAAKSRQVGGGAIIVVGEPGSGKTTLVQELLQHLAPARVVRVPPPTGGSASLGQFRAALKADIGPFTLDPFARLSDGSAVVVDDLELWWERREGGLAVVEHLLEMTREHGRRITFVLSSSTYAFDLLDRLVPFSSASATLLGCEPFSAEELRQAVMRRHQSTGLKLEYGSRSEEDVGEWGLARLFSRHFDHSSGNIATAFRSWLSHIDASDGESIRIRAPASSDWDALDEMDGDAKSLLLQLMLHKGASRARLNRVFGRDEADLERVVRDLVGASLLTESQSGNVSINESIRHQVGSHFLKRGLL